MTAVATFYSMYRRDRTGDYLVGVCTNTLCAIMGGDAIFDALTDHLDVGNDETTADGKITLQHIECNAACDYAPVVMVNWEFFDNQTPQSAVELVDTLRAGQQVVPSRGLPLCTFRETSRILAGFPDDRPDDGQGDPGAATLAGLQAAQRQEAQDGDGLRWPADTPLTPVLTRYWDDPKSWTLDTYRDHDGYQALAAALAMQPRRGAADRQGLRAARPRRRGLRHRDEMGFHSARRHGCPAPSRTTWWSTPTSPNRAPARTSR